MDKAGQKAQSNPKKPEPNLAAYPLSASLTLRVVNYLNGFRVLIGFALIFAFLTGILVVSLSLKSPMLIQIGLGAYLLLGLGFVLSTWRQTLTCFTLAQTSLFVDMLFLSLFYTAFGGLDSGLGVLLVFVSAAAAILLPLRLALFLAAITTIVITGQAFIGNLFAEVGGGSLLSAGLLGFTNFLTAILVHLLAYWARDYRLTAERQQRRLTRLEQINELIIRRMRGGVLAVDQAGEIQMMNESAWFLLGSPPSTDRILREVSPELFDALENWRKAPGGDTMPLTLNASQAQVVPKFVTLPGQQDIRVLVFLEDNDVVAQRALELSTSSLAKLSGSIAHEIRNPLAAISHAAQLLKESDELASPDQRLVEIINKQARRMNDIVENILQLSRREKSRPDLFELGDWLEDWVREFRTSIQQREVRLDTDITAGDALVMFDRSQLHQALWKLMENAVDHAGGDEEPGITLRLTRQDAAGYCVVSVENNGPGIPADQLPHIFEPFFTTRQHGSGLGLYVARQLCEANQAELTADSTPGWRTRFHIRMALASQDEAALIERRQGAHA